MRGGNPSGALNRTKKSVKKLSEGWSLKNQRDQRVRKPTTLATWERSKITAMGMEEGNGNDPENLIGTQKATVARG